jgi:hypothetical protein
VTEAEISGWMSYHLGVVPWPSTAARSLLSVERTVLSAIDPPLNLDEVPSTPLRTKLTQLRRSFGRDTSPEAGRDDELSLQP